MCSIKSPELEYGISHEARIDHRINPCTHHSRFGGNTFQLHPSLWLLPRIIWTCRLWHATAFHAIFHEMPPRTFDHTGTIGYPADRYSWYFIRLALFAK